VANLKIWFYLPPMLHSVLKVTQVLLHNNLLICELNICGSVRHA